MRIRTLFFLSVFSTQLTAQFDHVAVFPDQEGDELLSNIQNEFTPVELLSWADTRDTLYANVYAENDSISCIYSDHTVYMDPTLDPTQAIFMDGSADGLNTEHIYPQSKGASEGNARVNMYNLFPCKVDINSTRASNPYNDINDNVTDSWFYKDIKQSNIPSVDIDNYSEAASFEFEPRESVKGNLARVVMYFYTIYRQEANDADPEFFDLQKEALCEWHFLDPVDQEEWIANLEIASYQEDKSNPFVLDCTLAARLYCDNASAECLLSNADQHVLDGNFDVFPNPILDILHIDTKMHAEILSLQLYSSLGRLMHESAFTSTIDIESFNSGVYFLHIKIRGGHKVTKTVIKL